MKKTSLAAMALLTAAFVGCDIKGPKHYDYEAPAEVSEERDTVVFGFCGAASTQSRLQLVTASDDTVYFDVTETKKSKMVMPGYGRGDELYVLPDSTYEKALLIINKNVLLGEWVQPSPYDGSTPSGIILKDGGEAESFGQQGDILYKSWAIVNGKLQVVETRDDGTDIYYTQIYEIIKLTKDSLYISNSEETFEYGRYEPEPEVDLGIKFEEDDSDNYGIY